jgi:predicted alpha/beta-hydrolase family hydrolase
MSITPAPSGSHVTEAAHAAGTPARVKVWQMTATEWAICGVSCVGFAFDTYTLLVLT